MGEGRALPAGTQLDLKMVQEHRLAELEIQPESHLGRSGPEFGALKHAGSDLLSVTTSGLHRECLGGRYSTVE